MAKYKLVRVGNPQQWSFSNLPHFLPIINKHFEFESYQENKNYNNRTVFLIMASSYNAEMAKQFEHRRVIIDLCVEGLFGKWGELYKIKAPNHRILYGSYIENPPDDLVSVANFFWYNEALSNISKGYNTSYIPNKNFAKKFLMPIGVLPGESPIVTKKYDQRHLNPMWYDDTCFGVVVESFNGQTLIPEVPVFVTEKTFKPIAGHQPFMIIGGAGILAYLRSQGFETYDNIFDETYDTETNFDKKLDIIVGNIERYVKEPYSTKTLKKIKHNFKLFYNVDVIHNGIVKDIVEPIVKFIEQ